MPSVLTNEHKTIRFEFSDDWKVWPWDEQPEYRFGIGRLEGTKAVDIVGLYRERDLYFIEIKDYRVAAGRDRQKIGKELAVTVGHKTRDTIAGLTGAHRNQATDEWQKVMNRQAAKKTQIHVVLWMELAATTPQAAPKGWSSEKLNVLANTMENELKTQFRWLKARTRVVSVATNDLPGVAARNLPGAGFPAPRQAGGIP